jgi:hypothetical protein
MSMAHLGADYQIEHIHNKQRLIDKHEANAPLPLYAEQNNGFAIYQTPKI